MSDVYRVTGLTRVWTGGEKLEELRLTVVRRGGSLAYYENLPHATRGLTGLKGSGAHGYRDMRIEKLNGEWEVVNV